MAADTSSMVAFLEGAPGSDTDQVRAAFMTDQLVLPPPVFTELVSDPAIENTVVDQLGAIPGRPLGPGYWERAGRLRAAVPARKCRARLGDALIAPFRLDHDLPLITRDRECRQFAAVSKLEIVT